MDLSYDPPRVSNPPRHPFNALPTDGGGSGGLIRSHVGLRGVAAHLVVAYHQQFLRMYKFPFETATKLFARSYLMVDLFFILSGFIISYVYVVDREVAPSYDRIRNFLFARFARIYPLHLFSLFFLALFTLVTYLLFAVAGHSQESLTFSDLRDWLIQLVLLNAWIPTHREWNIPSWSISAEVFAYAMFPGMLALHARNSQLAQGALLVGCLSFYGWFLACGNTLDITVGLAPMRCIAGFALGMLLYFRRGAARRAPDKLLSCLQLLAVFWLIIGLASEIPDPLIIPAFAVLVWSSWPDRGLVAKLLSTRLFQWLGAISYSVYLMHVPIGDILWLLWSHVQHRLQLNQVLDRGAWLTLIFLVVLAASTLTFKFVEVPARRELLGWHRRRIAAGSAAQIPAP
jgi:peptidoglycan/LPS O-acetylase OafA/YrhL